VGEAVQEAGDTTYTQQVRREGGDTVAQVGKVEGRGEVGRPVRSAHARFGWLRSRRPCQVGRRAHS